jgi:hypothetical protein
MSGNCTCENGTPNGCLNGDVYDCLECNPGYSQSRLCFYGNEWYDSNGPEFDCDWYANFRSGFTPDGCLDGSEYPNFNLTAQEACCDCVDNIRYSCEPDACFGYNNDTRYGTSFVSSRYSVISWDYDTDNLSRK